MTDLRNASRPGKEPRLIPQGTTNLETPLELLDALITPIDRFFVRSNGPYAVDIDPATWRLHITGLVERELALSLADLQAMPHRTLTCFLECSGNSRSRFSTEPAIPDGTPWGNGAVGNAVWTGTPLAGVLEMAHIKEGAVDLVTQGGDFEGMKRGLPIATALDPEVLLVWEMNGEPLPAPHGGPVRLLVPGWGAIASTKWLVSLEVINHPFTGYYNLENYVFYDETGAPLRPVTVMPVKSVITTPVSGGEIAAGLVTVSGFAWSGYGAVTRVEVSTDGGATWSDAEITERAGRRSWVRFVHEWQATPGEHRLRSRATDERGLRQPDTVPWNAKGYGMNAVYEVTVDVSPAPSR